MLWKSPSLALRSGPRLAWILLVLITACQSDKINSTRRLSPSEGPPLKLSDIPYPVDPVNNSDSPISASVIRCGTAIHYDYHFCGNASGGTSGHYWYGWLVSICDTSDNCSGYDMYASGDDISNFEYVAPEYSAYIDVQAVVRESGNPNYTSYLSNAVLARGPLWGQSNGGSLNIPCYSSSYPFVETYDSSGTQVTRNYSRDFCTGQKVYAP